MTGDQRVLFCAVSGLDSSFLERQPETILVEHFSIGVNIVVPGARHTDKGIRALAPANV